MLLSRFIKSFALLLLYINALVTASYGQFEENDFIRYSVKDGISDNYIRCMQQDEDGYIWIGTDFGLNRFDGKTFKCFYQDSKDISLASSNIFQMKSFGLNRLGIWGIGGFQILNTHDFVVQNFIIPDSTSFSMYLKDVQDVVELPDKKIMMSSSAGIYVLDSNNKIIFRHDAYGPADNESKRNVYGHSIFALNNLEYLVYVEENGLAYYHAGNKTFTLLNHENDKWKYFKHPTTTTAGDKWLYQTQLNQNEFIFIQWQNDSIIYYHHGDQKRVASALPVHVTSVFSWESSIVKLDDSSFVINDGQNGFYSFSLNRKTGVINFSPEKYLPGYKIISLFIDKDKRLWAGTSKGLLQQKLNTPLLQTITFPNQPKDTISGGISSIFRYKNKFYLGRFSRRLGLLIVDTATMKVEKQVALFGNDNMWNEIRSIQMYHPDTLWLGTNGGIIWFDTKSEQYGIIKDVSNPGTLENFSAILAPARNDGYAWMCSVLQGVVARYHIPTRTFKYFTPETKPALPFRKIKSIAYDSYGDVWIGGHALARWNNRMQDFDTLIKVYGGVNKFNDDIVTLGADEQGSLWLHNAYNDLLQYRIKEKRFTAYTEKEGLSRGEIRTFSPIYNNLLWIGSNTTLLLFDITTNKIKVFDQGDGLPNERPSSRYMYFDSLTGNMYMPVNNSIVKFPQKYIDKPQTGSNLIIQELLVNNNKSYFNPRDNIELKSDENNLALYFTVIDFEEPDNYHFGYMINEADGWTDLGHQRNINLTGLSSGKYEIQIKAVDKSGEVKLQTFRFSIHPPFWKTTGFILLIILLAAGLGYFLYQYRIRQIKQKANLDKLLSQTEMKALHAQMNPHFIFNCLNSIREMILNNENKEASHFLAKFAQLIRVTLDQSGKTFISLHHTIDYLTRYIEMEQIRNELFTSRILADDELDLKETVFPPMLIQPFIENALWHGTKADDKKININIDFKKENNELICTIDDNGIGIEESFRIKNELGSQHISVGISNIKNRIKLLNEKYNLQYTLTIEDKSKHPGYESTGTLVTLRLPIQKANDE
ncbi:MAG TPA: histidine kinase [Ferruginibacter sp.]|nr:histidine kinase [Ferruginibacter sp.]